MSTIPVDPMEITPVPHQMLTISDNQMAIVPAPIPVSPMLVDQIAIVHYQMPAIPVNQMAIVPVNIGGRPKVTTTNRNRIE